ncbi:fructosamine kinase family protein [Halobacillus sp. A5]|uniref:fructosamine kinase family protein n=1 Tax=Halobacillus sp. A5 TaxID=2880263 RepID=UPI0020A6D6EA|nr:fructosamine kinase family protein [Halobacillus sp. A5]MCP3027508.1 fructosamine kinase family protein [Halobacillus sp. A5]
MKQQIERVLNQIGDHSAIREIKPVSGGDINDAFYTATDERSYFMKGNRNVPSHFFKAEAAGLEAIRQTQTVSVPEVYYYDEPEPDETALIALEWIDGNGNGPSQSSEKLGRNLALMHQHTAKNYGFSEDTFVGELDQPNDWKDSWVEYYRDNRLYRQYKLGMRNGRISGKRQDRLENLLSHLEDFIPMHPASALLHGDLWGGNYLTSSSGEPYLIDPSVLFGDPQFEIAFTELFGGFASSFYSSYQQVTPLSKEYEEVKPIYQLFYLLVHLNIFGETYGSGVDRILKKYIGS